MIGIERLNSNYLTALLTVKNLAFIYRLDGGNEERDNKEDVEDEAGWPQGKDELDIFALAVGNNEQTFAVSEFVHGRTYNRKSGDLGFKRSEDSKYCNGMCNGLRICANKTCLIDRYQ